MASQMGGVGRVQFLYGPQGTAGDTRIPAIVTVTQIVYSLFLYQVQLRAGTNLGI